MFEAAESGAGVGDTPGDVFDGAVPLLYLDLTSLPLLPPQPIFIYDWSN